MASTCYWAMEWRWVSRARWLMKQQRGPNCRGFGDVAMENCCVAVAVEKELTEVWPRIDGGQSMCKRGRCCGVASPWSMQGMQAWWACCRCWGQMHGLSMERTE